MLITNDALSALTTAFRVDFNDAFKGAEQQWQEIAMLIPSTTRENVYAWLSQMPALREWIGERYIKEQAVTGYAIENREWEATIKVLRKDVEDDQVGVLKPQVAEMGRAAAEFPDTLLFALLSAGFTSLCYDGQMFFDTEHPVDFFAGAPTSSNYQDGNGEAWYLLDAGKQMKPLIYQERRKPQFVAKNKPEDDHVFMRAEFLYGVDLRANAGYGPWQLAFGSRADLTGANYATLRAAMMGQRGGQGRILGVRPTTLVCSPNLEEKARYLLNAATVNASSNPWAGSAKLIVSPYLL